jgi:drug/metabolite transporter (DMT)-like permease
MTYLVPAIAIALGWLLLGEVPPPLAIAGGVVAIAGVIIARWTPRTRPPEPASATAGDARA